MLTTCVLSVFSLIWFDWKEGNESKWSRFESNGFIRCAVLLGTSDATRCRRNSQSMRIKKWSLSYSRTIWRSRCLCDIIVLFETVEKYFIIRFKSIWSEKFPLHFQRFYHYRIERLLNDHVYLGGSRAQEKFALRNNDTTDGSVNNKSNYQIEFAGPMELIYHFQKSSDPLITSLTVPCRRPSVIFFQTYSFVFFHRRSSLELQFYSILVRSTSHTRNLRDENLQRSGEQRSGSISSIKLFIESK